MSTYKSAWQCPSNIALVKYWGKKHGGIQLPANASVSFTLSNCHTQTALVFNEHEDHAVQVFLDDTLVPDFAPKIEQFIQRISGQIPFVYNGSWTVKTTNSFPHSSGIASSASGMGALALCICDVAAQKGLLSEAEFYAKASELARLGSGSASRSVYGPLAVWGEHSDFNNSNDSTAIPYSAVHPIFEDYCDTILLVHKGSKSVSSTVGHGLIEDHPYADARFKQAQVNMTKIKEVLASGNLDSFINLVESEALSLHALMMSSNPYFILMKAETMQIIDEIWKVRQETGVKWCFTLDAGANVHFLYPKQDEQKALAFVEKVLKAYCQDGAYICDQVGAGPIRLS